MQWCVACIRRILRQVLCGSRMLWAPPKLILFLFLWYKREGKNLQMTNICSIRHTLLYTIKKKLFHRTFKQEGVNSSPARVACVFLFSTDTLAQSCSTSMKGKDQHINHGHLQYKIRFNYKSATRDNDTMNHGGWFDVGLL